MGCGDLRRLLRRLRRPQQQARVVGSGGDHRRPHGLRPHRRRPLRRPHAHRCPQAHRLLRPDGLWRPSSMWAATTSCTSIPLRAAATLTRPYGLRRHFELRRPRRRHCRLRRPRRVRASSPSWELKIATGEIVTQILKRGLPLSGITLGDPLDETARRRRAKQRRA